MLVRSAVICSIVLVCYEYGYVLRTKVYIYDNFVWPLFLCTCEDESRIGELCW